MRGFGRRSAIPVAEAELMAEVHYDERGSFPFPPRPSLPPTLGCALGLWLACATVLFLAQNWDVVTCLVGVAIALVVALGFGFALWRCKAAQVWVFLLGLALGAACACAGAAVLHDGANGADGASGRRVFVAVEDGSDGAFGASCFARTTLDDGASVVVRVRFDKGEPAPRYGEAFEADATFAASTDVASTYDWTHGAVAETRARDVEWIGRTGLLAGLLEVRNRAIDLMGEEDSDGSAVLAALVCGWRGALNESGVYDAYKVTGLAHLVAVSGAHLSLVAAFAAALLRLAHVPRWVAIILQVALLLCYLVLAAAPPSAIRAAVMAFVGMLSFTAHRRPAALGALSLCMVGCIALSPTTALSVSFALSALSTLGIVVFASLFSAWIARLVPRIPNFARDALALTCASSLLATPLSAALFSQIPLVAPLANILAAPLFPIVCAGGLVAVVLGLTIPPVASVVVGAASFAASMLTAVVHLVATIPHASIPAVVPLVGGLAFSAVCAAVLWIAWPKPRWRWVGVLAGTFGLALIGLFILAPRLAADEVVMLDVGQGDAFLVRSQGASVLIDAGNQDKLLREALARQGVFNLDAVVITHGDDDHMGSLASLAGLVTVGQVLVANDALTCDCDACKRLIAEGGSLVGEQSVQGVHKGDVLHVGIWTLTVVWPDQFTDEGGNADSLCLVADADVDSDGTVDWRALFTGDAERDQLRDIIDAGDVGKVDIYKVGHHGSKNALDEQEARELSPRLALVSVGERNRYGHPAKQTLEALESSGAKVLRTDKQGDVSCKIEPDRIVVETLR